MGNLQTVLETFKTDKLEVESVLKVNENRENTMLNIVILNLDLRDEEKVTSVIEWIRKSFEFYREPKSKQHPIKPRHEHHNISTEDH